MRAKKAKQLTKAERGVLRAALEWEPYRNYPFNSVRERKEFVLSNQVNRLRRERGGRS